MPDARDTDDAELFRTAIGDVRPLPAHAPPPAAPKPRPRALMAQRDDAEALQTFRHALDETPLLADDSLSYRSEALDPATFKRLKRGEFSPQEELDLHGADARTAEQLVRAFLGDARRHGVGCVRIIHGKGGRGEALPDSSGAPVLKNLVDRLLRNRADVLGFHSSPAARGGTGSVVVVLAPKRR